MKKNEREESLGTRLKGYERDFETRINAQDYIVCRIDGHKFSKYTKGFKKPFDTVLSKAMVKTTEALVEKFGAVTGYTQSDEISLIFVPHFKETLKPITYMDIETYDGMCQVKEIPEYRVYDKQNVYLGYIEAYYEHDEEGYGITEFYITDNDGETVEQCSLQGRNSNALEKTEAMFDKYLVKEVVVTNEQIFGGRIQKMASLIAAFTTMTFNNIITDLFSDEMDKLIDKKETDYTHDELIKMLGDKCGDAWFDTRLYGVDSKEEVFNSLMWRVRDAEKNSRSMFAQTYCSHKSLLNKNGVEQVEFCKETTGKDWETIDMGYKYGFLTKRETYQKVVVSNEMGFGDEGDTVTRTRTVTWAEPLTSFSEEKVDMAVSKLK